MLISMDKIVNKACNEGYGIAAPNVFNQDMILAAFEAADEVKSPLILDCLGTTDLYAMGELTRFYSRKFPNVPVALNLDHGKTFEEAVEAIRAGFTSVMVD
ncbi:MAG: class II fructose-bisphosphate aldolase, partial [Thermoanaerobacteraceae bacterium]|nr:class II fructose-bisphosphate aldolase [Thermoanaerobacteraceae bacterium]